MFTRKGQKLGSILIGGSRKAPAKKAAPSPEEEPESPPPEPKPPPAKKALPSG